MKATTKSAIGWTLYAIFLVSLLPGIALAMPPIEYYYVKYLRYWEPTPPAHAPITEGKR